MNKKVNVIIPVCIAVSILYIFLAVRPLSKEIHFKTLWTTPCTRAATLPGDTVLHEEDYIPFKLGQTAGYFTEDGKIPQVEITSCGLNGGPLKAEGEYPAYIACNIWTNKPQAYVAEGFPKIMQECTDGEEDLSYITRLYEGSTVGFKYFDFKGVKKITLETRAYANGVFEIRTEPQGKVWGQVKVGYTNFWVKGSTEVAIPEGIHALYISFKGEGNPQLRKLWFE